MFRYVLAPYAKNSKGKCPSCGRKHTYRFYLDQKTGNYLSSEYGICDREQKCGYHYSPYINKPNNDSLLIEIKEVHGSIVVKDDEYYLIPKKIFLKSFENRFEDNFSKFLISFFGAEKAKRVLKMYYVGYSHLFGGNSTIFWQIDQYNQIRTGKIFKYLTNGKRDKQDYPKITWVHTKFKGDYKLQQCFFGAHLLPKFPNKKVKVVESEKTAIIMSIVKPEYIWLASTQLNGLNNEKLKILNGREVELIPDKGCFTKWKKKIDNYLENSITISNFVEQCKTLKQGEDIADYILNKNKNK